MENETSMSWKPELFREHLAEQPPEIIYHYTTQTGLLGIIKKKNAELWATKIQYLNDSTEFGLALRLAKDRLNLLKLNAGDHQKPLLEAMSKLDGIAAVNIFVACFSKDRDLLSQWRGYSGDNYGFSIAVKTSGLRETAVPHGFTLGRCIYEHSKQIRIIDASIERCLGLGLNPIGTAAAFERLILDVGAFFKDYGFHEEDEWRIVSKPISIHDDCVAFRAGKSMLTPYYRLPLGEDLRAVIDGVLVGPCPHTELSESSVRALLLKARITKSAQWGPGHETNVDHSAIPYRIW